MVLHWVFIFPEVTNGQIIDEKVSLTMHFLWKILFRITINTDYIRIKYLSSDRFRSYREIITIIDKECIQFCVKTRKNG